MNNHGRPKIYNVKIGDKYKNWEVIESPVGYKVKCRCKCDKEQLVNIYLLVNLNVSKQCKSCTALELHKKEEELVGQTIGTYKVLRRGETKTTQSGKSRGFWICQCLKCDAVIEKRLDSPEARNRECKNCLYHKYYKDIPMLYFNQIKSRAEKKELEFNITVEQLWSLFLQQNKICKLSGRTIFFKLKNDKDEGTASLDRIDSEKGYTLDNIQWVHKDFNWIKNNYGNGEFIEMCREVARYHS